MESNRRGGQETTPQQGTSGKHSADSVSLQSLEDLHVAGFPGDALLFEDFFHAFHAFHAGDLAPGFEPRFDVAAAP